MDHWVIPIARGIRTGTLILALLLIIMMSKGIG